VNQGRLGDRITGYAGVLSPAPFDAEGLDWLDRISALDVEEFACALAGKLFTGQWPSSSPGMPSQRPGRS